MKNINVLMSEYEYKTFGLLKNNFYLSEFIDLIERQEARQALSNCVSIADGYGISSMSLEDINFEIDAVRQCKR